MLGDALDRGNFYQTTQVADTSELSYVLPSIRIAFQGETDHKTRDRYVSGYFYLEGLNFVASENFKSFEKTAKARLRKFEIVREKEFLAGCTPFVDYGPESGSFPESLKIQTDFMFDIPPGEEVEGEEYVRRRLFAMASVYEDLAEELAIVGGALSREKAEKTVLSFGELRKNKKKREEEKEKVGPRAAPTIVKKKEVEPTCFPEFDYVFLDGPEEFQKVYESGERTSFAKGPLLSFSRPKPRERKEGDSGIRGKSRYSLADVEITGERTENGYALNCYLGVPSGNSYRQVLGSIAQECMSKGFSLRGEDDGRLSFSLPADTFQEFSSSMLSLAKGLGDVLIFGFKEAPLGEKALLPIGIFKRAHSAISDIYEQALIQRAELSSIGEESVSDRIRSRYKEAGEHLRRFTRAHNKRTGHSLSYE